MIIENITYRVRVKIPHDDDKVYFVNMSDFFEGSLKVRKQ